MKSQSSPKIDNLEMKLERNPILSVPFTGRSECCLKLSKQYGRRLEYLTPLGLDSPNITKCSVGNKSLCHSSVSHGTCRPSRPQTAHCPRVLYSASYPSFWNCCVQLRANRLIRARQTLRVEGRF
jgi:hypothetical protein